MAKKTIAKPRNRAAQDATLINLRALKTKVQRLHDTLGTLIHWIGSSAVSPISHEEAWRLLAKLDGKSEK
jgi:hypothetical protein